MIELPTAEVPGRIHPEIIVLASVTRSPSSLKFLENMDYTIVAHALQFECAEFAAIVKHQRIHYAK